MCAPESMTSSLLRQNFDVHYCMGFKMFAGCTRCVHSWLYVLIIYSFHKLHTPVLWLWRLVVSISFGIITFHNLAGGIKYSPKQKWYYYSFQNDKEVLVFHQYSRGKFFANAHGSFLNKNCPEDTEPRVSVEMRVALFF